MFVRSFVPLQASAAAAAAAQHIRTHAALPLGRDHPLAAADRPMPRLQAGIDPFARADHHHEDSVPLIALVEYKRASSWTSDWHSAKETALALELGFRVIGIEAHHDYYATVLARHRGNVTNGRLTLLHAAVSNSTGWQSFYRSGEASEPLNSSATMKLSMVDRDHKSEMVRLTTIDDVIGGDDCAALKLDIQGYEYEALLGATRLLKPTDCEAPLVMLEVYEAMRNDQRNLPHLRLLMGYGYTCYDVTSAPRHAFQSDLSLRHRSRCCKVRSNPWNIMACPKLYDDPTRINCAMPVFTDFVCVKHARTR